jgi:hypothetical protein
MFILGFSMELPFPFNGTITSPPFNDQYLLSAAQRRLTVLRSELSALVYIQIL